MTVTNKGLFQAELGISENERKNLLISKCMFLASLLDTCKSLTKNQVITEKIERMKKQLQLDISKKGPSSESYLVLLQELHFLRGKAQMNRLLRPLFLYLYQDILYLQQLGMD